MQKAFLLLAFAAVFLLTVATSLADNPGDDLHKEERSKAHRFLRGMLGRNKREEEGGEGGVGGEEEGSSDFPFIEILPILLGLLLTCYGCCLTLCGGILKYISGLLPLTGIGGGITGTATAGIIGALSNVDMNAWVGTITNLLERLAQRVGP